MLRYIIANIARLIIGITFILSGFVKAVDPIGTQYKLQDYAEAVGLAGTFPDWLTLSASVLLAITEFILGISVLFALRRKLTTRVAFAFMIVMTIITLWIYFANPVSDCGCFGDAIKLTNGETLLKNIILTALALIIVILHEKMPRMISPENRWIVFHYTIIFIIVVAGYSLYYLPIFDFRPYHIGANIPEGMQIPEGAIPPEFETTFILEKNGEQKEFSLENYPDSTWTFIDSKTKVIKEGYEPPIHDFSIVRFNDGEDITDSLMQAEGYTFMLISPHLEQANDSYFGKIDEIYEYAQDNGYGFYCLTASTEEGINKWIDITGAEYEFCNTDETTLKTIIRSNPGLILIKNGTVVGKWSHNELPAEQILKGGKIIEKSSFLPQQDMVGKKIAYILLWFVLPLTLLVIADRMWMWSKWVRKEETKQSNKFFKHLKKQKQDNGKENCCRQLEDEQEPAGGRSSR